MRLMKDNERVLITSSWAKSYASSDFARYLTPREIWERRGAHGGHEYWDGQNRIIDALLERAIVRVIEDDVGLVKGWICLEPGDEPVVHYVWVRQMYRGQGVARVLMADLVGGPAVYTHRSRGLDARRVPVGWRFDKVLAFLPKEARCRG